MEECGSTRPPWKPTGIESEGLPSSMMRPNAEYSNSFRTEPSCLKTRTGDPTWSVATSNLCPPDVSMATRKPLSS